MLGGGAAGGAVGAMNIARKMKTLKEIKDRLNKLSTKQTKLSDNDKKFLLGNLEHISDVDLLMYLLKNTNSKERDNVFFDCYNELKRNNLINTNSETDKWYKLSSILYHKINPAISFFTLVFGFICAMPWLISVGDILQGTAFTFQYYFLFFWIIPFSAIYICNHAKKKYIDKYRRSILD